MRRALLLSVSLGLLAGPALGQVIPPNSAQAQLADQWWQWIASLPASASPLLDQTGDQACQGLQDASGGGKVFFLAGAPGPNASSADGVWRRTFTVSAGVPLFFPIMNSASFNSPLLTPPVCTTMDCVLNPPAPYGQQIALKWDYPAGLYATLNNSDLATSFDPYWQITNRSDLKAQLPQFSMPAGDNLFGNADAVSGWFGQDGYYMELLLKPGDYVLAFGSDTGKDPWFSGSPWATVDTIHVAIPESSTWAMMLLGFGGLGYAAFARAKRAQAKFV